MRQSAIPSEVSVGGDSVVVTDWKISSKDAGFVCVVMEAKGSVN